MNFNWGLLQLGVFLSTFMLFVAAERLWPRRTMSIALISRWSANMGFTLANTAAAMLVHLVMPTAAVAAALYAEEHGIGAMNAIGAPWWLAVPLALAALDLSLYLYHFACHKIPVLWRFHRVHHLDLDVDATTAFRAHPLEYVSSQLIKLGVIYALGAPAIAVLAYEILLNIFAMFSHSNIGLSEKADALARRFIVTPDMHRVHHSTYQPETDSNYGVVTPLWDRLFGTYTAATRAPTTTMPLGLDEVRGPEAHNLAWLLAVPALSLTEANEQQERSEQAPQTFPVTAHLHTRAYRPPF